MEVVASSTAVRPKVTPAPARGRRAATLLAAALVLALVATAAVVVWLRGQEQDRQAAEQDRIAVLQATERFTETFNSFTAKDAAGYVERVAPLLSTRFRTEFTEGSADVVRGIQQQRLGSEGEVLVDEDSVPLVAVGSLDGDSAEALVVADARRVAGGQRVLRHWRWQVSLVKVDGDWLVDAFEEV
jgi:hypothetical protein